VKQVRRINVSGMAYNPRQARIHTITHAFCTGCGAPGSDRCSVCREKEKARIAANCGGGNEGDGILPGEWEQLRRGNLAARFVRERKAKNLREETP
jgi:hypothetical protein